MDKLKVWLSTHKVTVILVAVVGLLGVLGWLGVQRFVSKPQSYTEEVDLIFDSEGPYALLFPRRDGNALVLNLKRTSSYDAISYELAYTSKVSEVKVEGFKVEEDESGVSGVIDRGVMGTIDTGKRKGEYEQEILFGTCSKNVCKYDQGVENGTLTLHIKKEDKVFKMISQWHLQRPDVALGILTSGDGHFIYKAEVGREQLSLVGFAIVNDLTGVPKLPAGKEVLGKVYSLNVPISKQLPSGDVTLELSENPLLGAKLYRHDGSKWEELDTKMEGSKLFAKANGAGIFAVLVNKK